jgi:hypothetical protein
VAVAAILKEEAGAEIIERQFPINLAFLMPMIPRRVGQTTQVDRIDIALIAVELSGESGDLAPRRARAGDVGHD